MAEYTDEEILEVIDRSQDAGRLAERAQILASIRRWIVYYDMAKAKAKEAGRRIDAAGGEFEAERKLSWQADGAHEALKAVMDLLDLPGVAPLSTALHSILKAGPLQETACGCCGKAYFSAVVGGKVDPRPRCSHCFEHDGPDDHKAEEEPQTH